jgi:DNA repair photolyase
MAKRFHRATEETWKDMVIREAFLTKKFRKYPGRVMFPSSHDIVDIPEVKEICLTVLKNLLDADNEVLVTMKPSLKVTKDIVTKFEEFKETMQFRFTITSNNNAILSFWEPNAPSYEERLESLILAYKEGYKTSVSVEPFLDDDPVPLIKDLSPFITESIWIGPMNHMPRKNIQSKDVPEYDRIRQAKHMDNLQRIYDELINVPNIRFKDSMKIKLGLE